MLACLGIAFRDTPQVKIVVDVVGEGDVSAWKNKLASDPRIEIHIAPADWQKRLQAGKTDLVVQLTNDEESGLRFWEEPRRAESRLARSAVEAALLRAQLSHWQAPEVSQLDQVGSRYIDFLLPGMIGMGLMGGGLWGIGFVVVDMRVRKLLKRFLATPMRRSDFLLALMLSRLLFTFADVIVLLLFGYVAFGVHCVGSYLDLAIAVAVGGAAFSGIGLLVASRAQTLETASGLMNLVMLPMWVLSGVFFSSERFPQAMQPIINLLPLTALNQLLRGIMLEGSSLAPLWPQLALLAGYTAVTFPTALRIFRWR
jgi:ABC-type multidrug transport system permease subunit